jgi:hypothetical protein
MPASTSLQLTDPIVIAPGVGQHDGMLAVGTASVQGPELLPASLLSAVGGSPQGGPVQLGGHQFLRYLNLVPKGASTPQTVYALPTAAGTVIAACVAPALGATTFAVTCERAVSSVQVKGGSVLPLVADPAYGAGLSTIVSTLNSARTSAAGRLAKAGDPGAQARAAQDLAQAYQRAATDAQKLTPGPAAAPANAAIVAALKRLSGAYSSLAGAAKGNNGRAYDSARTAVKQASDALTSAFAQLQHAGYAVG